MLNTISQITLQPATQQIELEVEYAPEVTAQEIFVHAKSGNNIRQLGIGTFDDI